MSDIVSIISSVGFPIVSFLIAAYFIKYTYDKTAEANKEAMEKIGQLAEAVNHNSEVLVNLVDEIREKSKEEKAND